MLVLMVISVVVVLAVVVFVATGRGGGMSAERSAYAPLELGPVSATDVALLRPPTGLWGYDMQATDEAMEQIASSIRERDVRIVALEQLVTDLSRDQAPAMLLGSPYAGARHRRTPLDPGPDAAYPDPGTPEPTQADPVPESAPDPAPESAHDEAAHREPAWTEPAEPDQAWAPRDVSPTESVRFPFEAGRPIGDAQGPPPEQSHD